MGTFKWALAVLLAVAIISVAGCKRGASLVPVEGKVTLDNKPLAGATVVLNPSRGNGPGPFVATTNGEGQYSIGPTNRPGAGATPETYIVLITTLKPDPKSPEGEPPPGQKEIVPQKYRDGSERFTVPSEGKKDANFDIKTR